jgi:hypothetical protein
LVKRQKKCLRCFKLKGTFSVREKQQKLSDIKLFEHKKVSRQWNREEETWYFSVIDVMEILTDSTIPKR